MITKAELLLNIEIIECTINNFNGLDIMRSIDYLSEIVSLQSTATECVASSKYLLLEAINNELDRQAKLLNSEKIAPSIKKLRADAMCREWHYLNEKCERLARNISHTIDATRTKISYYKQEMENSKYQK